jgi:chain length determinant protein EpsF
MNPRQVISILLGHYKNVLLLFIVTVAATLVVSLLRPTQYTASASLLVDVRASDPLAAMIMPSSLATQVELINSDRVARRVVKLLKLDQDPSVKEPWLEATEGKGELEDWLAGQLQENLKVTPFRDKNIITIEFWDADPHFAADVANTYAQAYIDTVIELKVEPAKQYARWFEEQAAAQRQNLDKARARLSEYQRSKGIVEKDERMDYETARLRELSTQLTTVQAQTSDSRSKQSSGADTLPEIMDNPLISGLKADIARREATLQEAALNLGRNHPQYQRLESEIASLKQRLEVETQHITRSYSTASTVGQRKEAELRAAIEQQKNKLLALRNKRDELEVLQRDVDTATRAYETIANRYNQISLESLATRTNVLMLAPAVAPLDPSSPRPLRKILVIAIVLGMFLGGGAAFGLEMLDRRIRSADDLAEMLRLPVLGVITRVKPQAALPYSGSAQRLLR